jgi:hypothetical protein
MKTEDIEIKQRGISEHITLLHMSQLMFRISYVEYCTWVTLADIEKARLTR